VSTSAKRLVRIVGVDIATQPKNVGLGLGTLSGGDLRVESVTARESWDAIDAEVGAWVRSSEGAVLLALDAPLGWPAALANALRGHRAGAAVQPAANAMFRRRTDDVVAAALGKRPLDVGADRIARTAHAALGFLTRIRDVHRMEVPLAWQPGKAERVGAIEVYPAGTLASRGHPSTGYKGTAGSAVEVRAAIIERPSARRRALLPRCSRLHEETSDRTRRPAARAAGRLDLGIAASLSSVGVSAFGQTLYRP